MSVTKRQQIVNKATDLFSKHGFHPVGVDWIIDDSGVARMTMYRHFSGKEDLIREVLEQRYSVIVESIAQQMAPASDATSRLKAIFDWYEIWFRSPEFAGCLFERALAEFGPTYPKVSEVALRYREKLQGWMSEILREIVPPPAADRLASVCLMLLDGATIEARAFGDPTVATRAWQAVDLLLRQTKDSRQ
ncbi:TetR/AcrR family transcriptional regulator [Paraburkholderia agricolaris]|uniref:TetR/AcrR family transcriptional regulator n=1 Tax=Paraburkholderia agricolaris TaxID=2152888 RepID=A0ABW8ZN41_9BURK